MYKIWFSTQYCIGYAVVRILSLQSNSECIQSVKQEMQKYLLTFYFLAQTPTTDDEDDHARIQRISSFLILRSKYTRYCRLRHVYVYGTQKPSKNFIYTSFYSAFATSRLRFHWFDDNYSVRLAKIWNLARVQHEKEIWNCDCMKFTFYTSLV